MVAIDVGEVILILVLIIIVAIILSGIHILKEWQRAPVLTLGRYTGLKGPGIVYVTPIISKITVVLSTRIQAVAFKTESTFTQDNVPVNVDAVMYFQIIDPDKAVLNVENYAAATQLAAQTTLREVLGKSSFDEILSEREKIGEAARQIIDEKTEHWGVKVSSVEIRDVLVPQTLQDAMSRQAAAERERRSRVTLALAEVEAAGKMVDAAKQYANNPTAFQLRWMDIVYQIGLEGKGSLIMIPQNVPTVGDTSQFFTATALNNILSKSTGNVGNSTISGSKP
ncbi:SPFH domain-containing protein [Ferroplasma sp.]|jgi:regulator of protease activity HflC (stomatin/prohibitin superfamily)|uniref:SPFH domain-containing protein n=1 Tax=Ferroplasma sp. TaxID=2591003 RepID=UPI0026041D3F|nr:SPFH domain-containing protein [Ferroplasma sp.]MCL4452784.1 SPFH domain-containing protein [Candidatus Thermoplasmatota archaeon]